MKLNSILATDCGSTTTKAILIQRIDGEFRLTHRGEAPTTVEAPFEDVTRGVLNAVMEIEELASKRSLMETKFYHHKRIMKELISLYQQVLLEEGFK